MASTSDTAVRGELFGPGRRATTVGILLLVSVVAFEAMGVGTAMPALVADLGAVSAYAWPFVAFMAASVFGTVVGGRWCDRAGPRVPLLVALVLFGAGLVVAGLSPTMPVLLAGRVLQGLGAGALTVANYVLIATIYPDRARPAVFGLMSSAWVLPSLIGPPVAGVVTEAFSWHWVFLGLLPVVAVAIALVVPAVRALGPPGSRAPGADPGDGATAPDGRAADAPAPDGPAPRGRRGLIPAALAAAVGVSALSWALPEPGVVTGVVAAVAVLLLVPAVPRLLPSGVFRAARGVPAVVVARGLLAGVFFTITSYLPLMLNGTHGWSLAAAGAPLIVGSLGWSAASGWQARHPALPRDRLMRIGFALLTTGAAGMLLVAPAWGVPWLALVFWPVAGVGMGLGFSSMSYLLLRGSAPDAVGFHSAAAQIADQLATATAIGIGGALLALLAGPAAALPVLIAGLVVLGGLGIAVAGRTSTPA